MPQGKVKSARVSVNYDGVIVKLDNEEHMVLGQKNFFSFTRLDLNTLRGFHALKGATITYDVLKKGDTRFDGTIMEQDGHAITDIELSDTKSNLIQTLAEVSAE